MHSTSGKLGPTQSKTFTPKCPNDAILLSGYAWLTTGDPEYFLAKSHPTYGSPAGYKAPVGWKARFDADIIADILDADFDSDDYTIEANLVCLKAK